MKTKTTPTIGAFRPEGKTCIRKTALLGAATVAALLAVQSAPADDDHGDHGKNQNQVGDIFVFALENHNLTQPNPTSSPQQILGNPAAPYFNSLITPGNSNAVQVSYATAYYNAGVGVHPSEPNYVWAEAGTDFGFHSDADPSAANGNTFYGDPGALLSSLNAYARSNTVVFWHRTETRHLVGQLDAAGIPWKNYQEDVQLAASPTNSASGTNGPVNPYNGTTQFNYAVKHNPMAFFTDSNLRNVFPLAQLFTDLDNNAVGKYNWITPDQYNEAHSSLNGGFTYQGVHYTGDQSAIAACDNFLSIVLPQVMASKAYQNNGVIILWWDESEGGDDTNHPLGEVIISPLAKGNAYASTVPMNHSSDLLTMEEIFHLPFVNNPIPATETNVSSPTFNYVATVNDLSDLFVPGVIPSPSVAVTYGPFVNGFHTNFVSQTVKITNDGDTALSGPLWLALDDLTPGVTLLNSAGHTQLLAPLGSPYVAVDIFGFGPVLEPHQSANVILEFQDPGDGAISYTGRVLNVTPAP